MVLNCSKTPKFYVWFSFSIKIDIDDKRQSDAKQKKCLRFTYLWLKVVKTFTLDVSLAAARLR